MIVQGAAFGRPFSLALPRFGLERPTWPNRLPLPYGLRIIAVVPS